MSSALVTLTLLALAADPIPSAKDKARMPSSVAPSLPAVTKEEEEKFDEIIDRFIRADTGKLRGAAAKKAFKDLDALKPAAIPALIRGLNRAAKIEHSCPVTVIAKKLHRMLMASEDPKLLEYARDEIGAGVGRTTHSRMLQDLRFKITMRQNALARRPPPQPRLPRFMTTSELVKAASSERGPRLKGVLTELETRKGKDVVDGLSIAAASYDRDTQKLGRELLERHLGRQGGAAVKAHLESSVVEVRRAAIRVVAAKHPSLGDELIALLGDDNAEVRNEARQGLVKISGGEDFGPTSSTATKAQRERAQRQWRAWWARRNER
jgi:hypothetical protein